jgi:ketosteroid isomerase-like protein
MPDSIRSSIDTLTALVARGAIMEAFEQFYADDVVMGENTGAPTVGKRANRERERAFVAFLARLDRYEARSVVVDEAGGRAVIHWIADFVGTDGVRYHYDQLAHQVWRDGRIVEERFYYDSASLVQAA